ncbi:thiol-disulfide oxidoreductase ResA family protein [Paenibacillus darwinianus]|uniref:Thiol-disulfide oxidoreductase ResA family protein n=1 Tax=Paenibacillus darwinianus TaxID=1380763 RepID=A0A9W5RZR3_9BACL|nr:TlpA disulfide reductase family protein [Paenibacillus darwinianus]EXX86983.1 thiol-disulfide oxidoreductase ResA family protein [Paenibacillus darwinianus]EXX87189.1 thiol-disulfide oxidoreductase ResA family protein [Paenibacillus darwinianus]EXX87217.1 thiol-disulfide oxidoreductase ResA family protein [Paenibacillus darwinianus]
MNRRRSMLIVIAMLAIFAFYQNADKDRSEAAPTGDAKPKKGYAAPSFELPDLADRPVRVGGPADKVVLINFWASWCGPCILEAPDLQKLYERYKDTMTLIGVNATKYDREREARQFVDDFGLTFPILMDRKGAVTDLYNVAQFPTTLLVDKNGVIRERITGVIPVAKWESLIEKWN